ncbi:hypothetical protein [Nocardia sp. CY41]|uniref:hypothetical protein n=1 Tax=Nocardia sp. CY41 TaxID=2608686 RepID=UPI0019153BA1|nr:hypothetical protein [Nocardia sp. CY41]
MADRTVHRRAYELWTDERNIELVELLRSGLPVEQIAERAGRSVCAIRGQCRKLLPPHYRITAATVVPTLRMLLATPDFDWRESLRERHRRARSVYWDTEMTTGLRQAWTRARPLPEICEEFDASEIEVARQLMRLDLAENMREVADHLGCDPAGTLAGRLRVAADRTTAAVWVLIIDGPATGSRTRFGDAGPALRHVSVHHDYDTAELTLADVMFDHLTQDGSIGEVTATIAERTVGDLTVGSDAHLTGPDALPVSLAPTGDHQAPDNEPVPTAAAPPPVDLDDDSAPGPDDSAPARRLWRRWRK